MVAVQLKLAGINKLLKSAPVQAKVDEVGTKMAATAGDGFEYVRGDAHRYTSRGFVQTNSARGARRQAKEAVLERALGRVRGG